MGILAQFMEISEHSETGCQLVPQMTLETSELAHPVGGGTLAGAEPLTISPLKTTDRYV